MIQEGQVRQLIHKSQFRRNFNFGLIDLISIAIARFYYEFIMKFRLTNLTIRLCKQIINLHL